MKENRKVEHLIQHFRAAVILKIRLNPIIIKKQGTQDVIRLTLVLTS